MSAEEEKNASTEAAPAVEPSTNGNGDGEAKKADADSDAMEVDAPAPAEKEDAKKEAEAAAAAAASEEKKDDEAKEEAATTDAKADSEEKKEDEEKDAEPKAVENQEEASKSTDKPASTKKESSSKPAAPISSRQTRPKPESAKPASSANASANASENKKVARPRSSLPASSGGASGKGKTGSAATSGDKSFSVGDIVLGRLKGYPPWPARVCSPDDVPQKVNAQRPSKSPSIYVVQYFPAGDYSWLNAREISPLSSSDIDSWLNESHRKGQGNLRAAYETAKDPSEWDETQANARAEALDAADDEDEDMEVDELEDEEGEQTGGKRKKVASGKKAAPAKKAKTEKKAKPEAEAPKSKAKAATKKAEKPEAKPAPPAEPAGDDDPLASDPICVKVKGWRHTLQRAFLGKELPSPEEMPAHDETFKKIEQYSDMTIQALQYSKIGKVMKKISTLGGIPKDDELHIRERAAKLMNDWHAFIEKEQGAEGAANGDKE